MFFKTFFFTVRKKKSSKRKIWLNLPLGGIYVFTSPQIATSNFLCLYLHCFQFIAILNILLLQKRNDLRKLWKTLWVVILKYYILLTRSFKNYLAPQVQNSNFKTALLAEMGILLQGKCVFVKKMMLILNNQLSCN